MTLKVAAISFRKAVLKFATLKTVKKYIVKIIIRQNSAKQINVFLFTICLRRKCELF